MRSIALLWAVIGCNPVYAPPVRGTHYGAPGRLAGERIEVGGAAAGVMYPYVGGPHVAVGLSDEVSLEAGGNFQLFEGWAIGWVGARFTRPPQSSSDWSLDAEVGAGAGIGGRDCESDSCVPWTSLTTGGAYAGLGLAYRGDIPAVYVRSRLEVSVATGIEPTLWPTAMIGFECTLERAFVIGAGGGYLGLFNEHHSVHGWFYQLQTALLFDLTD